MAQVDFSNASLQPAPNKYPLRYSYNMLLNSGNTCVFKNSQNSVINSDYRVTETSSSLTHKTLVYTGKFIASGTEFYIGELYGSAIYAWKVSNISFQNGDTYSFAIDIDVSIV